MKKILFFLFLFFFNFSFSANVEIRLLNASYGLNANFINDIASDNYDNIWLGTNLGLKKFDGYNFIDYNIPNYNRKEIKKIIYHKESLYILYKEGFLLKLDINTGEIKNISTQKILDFHINSQKIVLLKSNFNIEVREGKRRVNYNLKFFKKIPIQDSKYLYSIIIYNNSIYFSIPQMGLFCLKKNKILNIANNQKTLPGGYRDRLKIINDKLYFISFSRHLIINKNNSTQFLNLRGKDIAFSTDLTIKDNAIYYLKNDNSLIMESSKESVPILNNIKNIELRKFIFLGKHIYISTNKGLYEITEKNNSISSFNLNNYLTVKRKIIEEKDKLLFFGYPYVISKEGGEIKKLTIGISSIYDAVKVKNTYYLATEGGEILNTDENFKHFIPLEKNSLKNYTCIYYDIDTNLIYYGDNEYVYALNPDSKTVKKTPNIFKGFNVKSIIKDRKYNQLIVGTENGLFTINLKNKSTYKLLSNKIIGDLLIDKNSQLLWVGCDSGILIYDLSTLKLIKSLTFNFLKNPRVVSLIQDNQNRIWGSTYSGLIAFDYNSKNLLEIRNSDLINEEYNYKSASKLKNGKIIFGGLDGYDEIDPSKFDFSTPEITGKISGYHIIKPTDSTYNSFHNTKSISFENKNEFLRVYISTNHLINKHKCNFQYKLDNTNWIDLKQQYIDLVGLAKGDYTLQIRGVDEMGKYIKFSPANIIVTEEFYKSNIFLFSLILMLLVLIIIFSNTVINKLRLKNEIYEKISMDLHDEVGTILSKTNLLIAQNQTMNYELKNKIQKNIKQANFGLRANINSLKEEDKHLIYLYHECIEVMESFLNIKKIPFKYSFAGNKARKISKSLYKDLKLSFFEIFNNTLKYSSTDSIDITFIEAKKILIITILEKNNFINFEKITYGNGLKNIQKRIERNNGSIEYSSEKEKNFYSIVIRIKL